MKQSAPWRCSRCGATLATFDVPCVPPSEISGDKPSPDHETQKGADDE